MSQIAAIISEYNPFHNGHAYQIRELRKNLGEDTAVVAIMSGNFTQRGEAAIYDKYTRASAALACGADLVLELPFPYCCGSAEFFASAGVRIAGAVGADTLVFGSECGDLEQLTACAEIACSARYRDILEALEPEKIGYAAAHEMVYAAFSDEKEKLSDFVPKSNDILAIEYIRAILRAKEKGDVGGDLIPLTVKRVGADYRETALSADYPSATAVRAAVFSGETEKACAGLPSASAKIVKNIPPVKDEIITDTLFKIWRLCDPQDMAQYAECGGGLAHRLHESARNAASAPEFFADAASKNCTNVKLRRAALFGVCGVMYRDLDAPVPYTVTLAFNERGRAVLHDAQRISPIPVITKPALIKEGEASRYAVLLERADALYTAAMCPVRDAGYFLKCSPVIQK